jgi:3-phosphoshikimate 1-carboxyvinyltransferase
MTVHVMRSFGAVVDVAEPNIFTVSNRDRYIGRAFTIEGDATAATYFAAAAAITKGRVFIENITRDSLQGDVAFFSILEEMGCSITERDGGIEIAGGSLSGIELDMNNLPDCVPTLAVVALFAAHPTTITNVGHLRHKESNRLLAIAAELKKLGAGVELFDEGITIRPGKHTGASIATYNDHRMAMSFAVAGLAIPGIRIINPGCVSKSYPQFWSEFEKLEGTE